MYRHYICDISDVHHVALCCVPSRCVLSRWDIASFVGLCFVRFVSLGCVRYVMFVTICFATLFSSFLLRLLCVRSICVVLPYVVSHRSGFGTLRSIALWCATLHCSKSVFKGRRCCDIEEAKLINRAKIVRSCVVFQ